MSDDEFEPPYLHPAAYRATVLRAPTHSPIRLPPEWFHHAAGPAFGRIPVRPKDADLTRQHSGAPLGERIVISGVVRDSEGHPVQNTILDALLEAHCPVSQHHSLRARLAAPAQHAHVLSGR